ncbi:MAG TPA: hypothetical protein VGG78_00240, partial [Gemmatimonadaceae bacterium]
MTTHYTIDQTDRLTGVDAGWRNFALANGAPELADDGVLGRRLWEFVAGAEVRLLYQALFARVRSTGTPIEIPFRCDAPDRRRFMRLSVRPLDQQDWLALTANLEREERRPPVDWPTTYLSGRTLGADQDVAPTSSLIHMCSWCKRIDCGGWLEIEEAMEQCGLMLAGAL